MNLTDASREFDVLLLDFGGVCLLNPVEMHAIAEERLALPAGTFTWLGPVDPSTDELWQRMVAGEGVTEREYWAQRAVEVGAAAGRHFDVRDYMIMLYEPPTPDMIRPEAVAVVEAATAAGYGVSVLTNDLRAFHGREWEHQVDFLGLVDHLVDCSDTGILKPDARAYARAAEMVGVDASRMLFVDDQPLNVAGAEACGMTAVWFDVSDATGSWRTVAERLGLALES